ncbi:AAA family ATPase [Vibrio cholerae]|uniref:AAA family ATPase n=1 Tax=Vibrio cholerae TaxID=666 RepID=UPI00115C127C|nr:AAA family ATPase [Vibrio cholerae]TQP70940.1 AAA family ATPase [Vibrio cholerae]TQP92154.1 AAA family ATPase [Vibrio cholerae]
MSESIILKGVASYSHITEQKIDISKPNCFIYGLNGTGKSTISNLFYRQDDTYKDCRIDINQEYHPLVYNHSFIDDSFATRSNQEGIFTLSKDNKDLQESIDKKEAERQGLAQQWKLAKQRLDDAEKEQMDEKTTAIDSVYRKIALVQNTKLYDFLEGAKRPKAKYYSELIKYPLSADSEDTIDALEAEYQQVLDFQGKIVSKVSVPTVPDSIDEFVSLLSTPIVASGHSQLSSFISKLGNQEWVRYGKEHYLRADDTCCPFCQSESIDSDFRQQLSVLFDQTFDEAIGKIELARNKYQEQWNVFLQLVKSSVQQSPIYNEDIFPIEPIISGLAIEVERNIQLFAYKLEKPMDVIQGLVDIDLISLTTLVDRMNIEADLVNKKTSEISHTRTNLSRRVWLLLRKESEDILRYEKQQSAVHEAKIKQRREELELIGQKGTNLKEEIIKLRSKVSNIEDTIERINSNLVSLGVVGFKIVKAPDDEKYFTIEREGKQGINVYRTLSEGEKTLITFLYFLEKCSGSQSSVDSIPNSEKVIVVDDPISSLSQNYIYEVASLIHSNLLSGNKFLKVIVLTHSLFFFHELLKLVSNKKDECALYCIKKQQNSYVEPIGFSDLKNEYQSLWQILSDAKNGKINPVVIPNVMRNILEHYYGFVHKKNQLGQVLNELMTKENSQELKAFFRYINRQSHSDPINQGLITSIEPTVFLDKFKLVFEKTGDQGHYDKMIDS